MSMRLMMATAAALTVAMATLACAMPPPEKLEEFSRPKTVAKSLRTQHTINPVRWDREYRGERYSMEGKVLRIYEDGNTLIKTGQPLPEVGLFCQFSQAEAAELRPHQRIRMTGAARSVDWPEGGVASVQMDDCRRAEPQGGRDD